MPKITFSCDSCGQQLAVRDEHAGRKVRCTSCQGVLVVPDADDAGDVYDEPPRESIRDSGPKSGRGRRDSRPDDFDAGADRPRRERAGDSRARRRREEPEDDFDEAPRRRTSGRRRKKKGGGPWKTVAVIVVLLLVLGGAGFGVYYLLSGGTSDDLKLVPSDAAAFVSVRPNDLFDSHWGKKLRDKMDADDLEDYLEKLDLEIKDVERITVFMPDSKDVRGPGFIILTEKSFEKEDKLKSFEKSFGDDDEASSDEHEEKTYFVLNGQAIYFHSNNILVFGSEEAIKSSIAAVTDKDDDGPLKEAKSVASSSSQHVTTAINRKADGRGAGMGGGPLGKLMGGAIPLGGFGRGKETKEAIAMYTTASFSKDVDVEAGFVFEDTDEAEKATKKTKDELKDRIEDAEKEFKKKEDEMSTKDKKEFRMWLSMRKGASIGRSGKIMTYEISVDSEVMEELFDR